MSLQPYYFAKRFAYGTSFRSGVIEYSRNVNTNVAAYYISSSGNGYFKPLLRGVYFVMVNDIGSGGGSPSGTITGSITIRKNSSVVTNSHWNTTSYWENITVMAHVSCNGSTDIIDIYVESGSIYGDGSGAYGSLAIHYISG